MSVAVIGGPPGFVRSWGLPRPLTRDDAVWVVSNRLRRRLLRGRPIATASVAELRSVAERLVARPGDVS